MTYFAIGESTGGAGERRLGPFGTPDEAESAGRRETKDSNGEFVFKGVVDEANNQVITDIRPVSTNAVVRNAMAANRRTAMNWGPWKPGQRVKEENGTRTGTVVKQGGLNDLLVTVKWDDGKTEDMHRFQLKAANRRVARNADDYNVKLEQIAKKYLNQIGVALSTVESFNREAGRYAATVVVSGYCDDAIQALRTIKEWCKNGATYGFDD